MRVACAAFSSLLLLVSQAPRPESSSPRPITRDTYILSVWGSKWSLLIDLPNLTVEDNHERGISSVRRITLREPASEARLTVTLLHPIQRRDLSGCRQLFIDDFRGDRRFKVQDIVFSEGSAFAFARYLVAPSDRPGPATYVSDASIEYEGLCANVRTSSAAQGPRTAELLHRSLATLRFQKGAPKTSFDLLQQGDLDRNDPVHLRRAIDKYSKALALENATPRLEKPLWLSLVASLALDLCWDGKTARAIAVARLGLAKDATYPLLYYDLACAAARQKDAEGVLGNLRLSYEFRKSLPHPEDLIDPRQDDVFFPLMRDAKFRQEMDALMSPMDHHEFELPETHHKLAIDLPHFTRGLPAVWTATMGKTSAYVSTDGGTPVNATVTLEPSSGPAAEQGCLESLELQAKQTTWIRVKPYQAGSMTMMEYSREDSSGESTERVLLVCRPVENTYLFLELSKANEFNAKDRTLITQILNSIRLVEAAQPH